MGFPADDVIDEFRRYASDFMESLITKFKQNGKARTSETYTVALNSFKKFLASQASKDDYRKDEDIMLDCLTSEIMKAYEAWHK